MNIRIIASIVLFTFSTTLYSQDNKTILGTWIKTKIEAFNKQSNTNIEQRDEQFIKYTFEKNGQMYISSVYNEKGFENKYTVQNGYVNLLFNKFKIEKLDDKQLILVELDNGKISNSSARIFLKKEQLYLEGLTLNHKDVIKVEEEQLYLENEKVYPKFKNKDFADVKNFIQPYVEGRSKGKEFLSYSTFVVNTDGSVSDIQIHHHINKSYDKHLIKAIRKTSGMWVSPTINEKKVKVIKEVVFHYIEFPDLIDNNGKVTVDEKGIDLPETYASLFRKATKEVLRGHSESALTIYSECSDLPWRDINIIIQKNLIYKKINDSLNFDRTEERIKDSEYKYVFKL